MKVLGLAFDEFNTFNSTLQSSRNLGSIHFISLVQSPKDDDVDDIRAREGKYICLLYIIQIC